MIHVDTSQDSILSASVGLMADAGGLTLLSTMTVIRGLFAPNSTEAVSDTGAVPPGAVILPQSKLTSYTLLSLLQCEYGIESAALVAVCLRFQTPKKKMVLSLQ